MDSLNLKVNERTSIQTVGRRKSAVATVHFCEGKGEIIINGKPSALYTQADDRAMFAIPLPFKVLYNKLFIENLNVEVKVKGGGIMGQAKAIQLGIARALLLLDSSTRPILKAEKLLTRDSRVKERKKYGLKKARKAPQFSKR